MNDKFRDAFDTIKAEDSLKNNTIEAIYHAKQPKKKRASLRRLSVAMACVFAMIFGGFYYLYATPLAYVDIDINPSLELTINRFDRVIDARAYNEDAEKIIATVKLKNRSYDEALALLVEEFENQGYITNDGLLSVTVQSNGKNEEALLQTVQESIDHSITNSHHNLKQNVYLVNAETKAHAHEEGVSPAKYQAIMALLEIDGDITFEECKSHSISELHAYAQEHDSQNHDAGGETPGGSQNHHGAGHE